MRTTSAFILVSLMSIQICFGQQSSKKIFGIKGIDHESIAIRFMKYIKGEEYDKCYSLVSDTIKSNLNFEDFEFKMRMLNNLFKNDEFFLYETNFIGLTPESDFRNNDANNKELKDVMPEYDFTLKSDSIKKFKTVRCYLRFENENSEKIQVINYGIHSLINEEYGISNLTQNPFFQSNYILIIIKDEDLLFDVRGWNLRERYFSKFKLSSNECLNKMTIEQFKSLLQNPYAKEISLIVATDNENNKQFIKVINIFRESDCHLKGFNIFFPKDVTFFVRKYKNSDYNPLGDK